MKLGQYGSVDVQVLAGESLAVSVDGSNLTEIFKSNIVGNQPERFILQDRVSNTIKSYGPYSYATKIRIVSNGNDVDYGLKQFDIVSSLFSKSKAYKNLVLFGDSITASCGGPNYFNTTLIPANPPTGQPAGTTCVSWFHLANGLLGMPWKLAANLAIGGGTVTTAADGVSEYYPMVSRWDDVLLFDAGTVMWGPSGINDIKSNGKTGVDRVIVGMQEILDGFLAAGLQVIKVSLLPMADVGGSGLVIGSLDPIANRSAELYRKEKELFSSYPNVLYIDVFNSFVNKTSRYLAGDSSFYYDGLHPNNKGAWVIARAIQSRMSALVTPKDVRPIGKNDSFFGTRKQVASVTIANGLATVDTSNIGAHNMYLGDSVIFSGNTAPVNFTGPYPVVSMPSNTSFVVACPNVANGSTTGTTFYSVNKQLYDNPFLMQNTTDVVDTGNQQIAATSITGTISGTYPADLRLTAGTNSSVVASLVDRADGRGKNAKFVVTTTAAVSSALVFATKETQHLCPINGKYKGVVGINVYNADVAFEVYANIQVSHASGTLTNYALNNDINCNWDTQNWGQELIFETKEIEFASLDTRSNAHNVTVRFETMGAGTFTVEIGLPCIIKTE